MTVEKDYVLGTHDEEIERLGLQHQVWQGRATDAWRRAGFATGQTLVDLGCGPGWAALDLGELIGPSGRVLAIDRSRRFLDALERAARDRSMTWIETRDSDLDQEELPAWNADGIWSRWIYAFVREPRRLLRQAANTLRAGGVMVIHEYVDYRSWRLSPRRPEFEAFVNDVMASWRADGGEPDIGLCLPRWLDELGFEIRSLAPIVDVARPADQVWRWPRAFVQVGVGRLVELGRLDTARADAIRMAFEQVEATPGAFMVTPMVIEIIAVRR
ncbi:MAG: methyltransferase domain-containing protein [Candidatus Eisenbacteria bacterium]